MAIIIILIIALLLLILYLAMTCAQKAPASGAWLTQYKYAHRGLHDSEKPENTIPAFTAAIDNGYGIELDVHLSSDGELMVFHDKTLDRMTGKTGRIEDYTAAELTAIKVNGTAYAIPTLKEVLDTVNGAVPLLIETKNESTAGPLEEKLSALMKTYGGLYAVQSFSPFSIGWFYKNDPQVLRGQLSATFEEGADDVSKIKRFFLRYLLTNFLGKPQFVSYEVSGISSSVVRRMRRSGAHLLEWVVRSPETQKNTERYTDTIIFEDYRP